MDIPATDLLARLHAVTVEIDQLERRGKRLQERVSRLGQSQQAAMPTFSGPWTKHSIEVHLERVEEWIRTPVKSRNRTRLETAGVEVGPLEGEILEDSDAADAVAVLVEEIVAGCPELKAEVTGKECLGRWLKEGINETKAKLAAVKQGLDRYKRLVMVDVSDSHRAELIGDGVREPDRLADVEAKATKTASLLELGLEVPPDQTLAKLWPGIRDLDNATVALKGQFPEHFEELRGKLKGSSLTVAQGIVSEALEDCRKRHQALMAEWEGLHRTICLLGLEKDGAVAPKSIVGLQQQIAAYREQCYQKVGEKGVEILAFFQGERDFPDGLSLEALREALLALKPFISVGVGGRNA